MSKKGKNIFLPKSMANQALLSSLVWQLSAPASRDRISSAPNKSHLWSKRGRRGKGRTSSGLGGNPQGWG